MLTVASKGQRPLIVGLVAEGHRCRSSSRRVRRSARVRKSALREVLASEKKRGTAFSLKLLL